MLSSFGNLFSGDGVIILLILLLLYGAKRLPELAGPFEPGEDRRHDWGTFLGWVGGILLLGWGMLMLLRHAVS